MSLVTTPQSPRPPRPPFDDADADIIFRSSDHIDFRLYKVILAKASPVFREMFTLPHNPDEDDPQVVQLTEDAFTLENLLRLCCPVEHPKISYVDHVHAVLEAAQKYEMQAVIANLRWVVKRIIHTEPLRIYAVAYSLKMEDVCREAAFLLLDDPQFHIPTLPPKEFDTLPSRALYAVHVYRKKCVEAALGVLAERDWILNGAHDRALTDNTADAYRATWTWVTRFGSCTCTRSTSSTDFLRSVTPFAMNFHPAKWWVQHMRSLSELLALRPTGNALRSHLTDMGGRKSLEEVASCRECMPKVYSDLTLFNELLAQKVDAAIETVRLRDHACFTIH